MGRGRGDEDDDRPGAFVTRIGVQDRLVPGATVVEKYEAARRFGFDALELSERIVKAYASSKWPQLHAQFKEKIPGAKSVTAARIRPKEKFTTTTSRCTPWTRR